MHSCFNGHDGIFAAKDLNIDLLILDINMPEMSGYQVIKILRTIDIMKDTPIVFFSANAQKIILKKLKNIIQQDI